MDQLDRIKEAARDAARHIVLAEGEDPRIIKAAQMADRDGLARLTLIGDPDVIARGLKNGHGINIINPAQSDLTDGFVAALVEARKHKGMTPDKARGAILAPLGFAAMMVRDSKADGTIAGAVATTSDTVRAALQIVGKAPGISTVSSFFLMLLKAPYNRPVVFADCGLIIEPTAPQLADIAISSAQSFQALTGETAKVAMLSFSTKGSAKDGSIDRIAEALAIVKDTAPTLDIDGELQFDAALLPDIAARKAAGSNVAGAANVFVFPNLNAGNIGYKIAQRIGGATALGPVLQGLARPANDLSRGCSVDDIYQMIAVTAAQAGDSG